MHKHFLLVCFCFLCSCATLLHGKKDKVYIHAPKNTKVKFEGDELIVKEDHVTIFPTRSRDSLKFELSNDSISTEFAYRKRTSGIFYLNFLSPYYLGFIVEILYSKLIAHKIPSLAQITSPFILKEMTFLSTPHL